MTSKSLMPKPGELFPSFADPNTWRDLEAKKYLRTSAWKSLRVLIKKKFDHRCQFCGFKSQDETEVHHIDGDFNNEKISNLTVICKLCHLVIHSGQGVEIQKVTELYASSKISQVDIIKLTRKFRAKGKNDDYIKNLLGLKTKMPFRMNRGYLKKLFSFPTIKTPNDLIKHPVIDKTNLSFYKGKAINPLGALKHSFCIFPGSSYSFEQSLYKLNILDWDSYISSRVNFYPKEQSEHLKSNILSAMNELKEGRADFLNRIPRNRKRELWRSYQTFQNRCLYIDIESTGLNFSQDKITVVGAFDGKKVFTFVHGINLNQFPKLLNKYPYVVTYNGSLFDIRMIQSEFPRIKFNQINFDLRWPLFNFGIRGGLSGAEKFYRIKRKTDFPGQMSVDLWEAYENGYTNALKVLKQRVIDDVIVLKPLAERIYNRLLSSISLKIPKIPETKKIKINLGFKKDWFRVINPEKIGDIPLVIKSFGSGHPKVAEAIEYLVSKEIKHYEYLKIINKIFRTKKTAPNGFNYSKGEKYVLQAIEIRKRTLSASDRNLILKPLKILSKIYTLQNKKEKLLLVHNEIMRIATESYKNNPESLGEVLEKVSKEKFSVKQYKEAEKLLIRVIKIKKRFNGINDDDYLKGVFNDLADCYFYLGKYKESRFFYMKILKVLEKELDINLGKKIHILGMATLNEIALKNGERIKRNIVKFLSMGREIKNMLVDFYDKDDLYAKKIIALKYLLFLNKFYLQLLKFGQIKHAKIIYKRLFKVKENLSIRNYEMKGFSKEYKLIPF